MLKRKIFSLSLVSIFVANIALAEEKAPAWAVITTGTGGISSILSGVKYFEHGLNKATWENILRESGHDTNIAQTLSEEKEKLLNQAINNGASEKEILRLRRASVAAREAYIKADAQHVRYQKEYKALMAKLLFNKKYLLKGSIAAYGVGTAGLVKSMFSGTSKITNVSNSVNESTQEESGNTRTAN